MTNSKNYFFHPCRNLDCCDGDVYDKQKNKILEAMRICQTDKVNTKRINISRYNSIQSLIQTTQFQ